MLIPFLGSFGFRLNKKNTPINSGAFLRVLQSFVSFVSTKYGGPEGDRTLGLCVANAALSQLSYEPSYKLNESGS